MQRKILVSPKKGLEAIDHGNKMKYFHFANQNITSWLLLHRCQIKISNHLNNTQCPWCYPLSKNPNAKKELEIKKR